MYAKIILANCFCAALFSLFLWLFPVVAAGEVYQWTDDRGVIHFTDSLQSVPADMRGSPDLTIRTDIKNEPFEIPAAPLSPEEEAGLEPQRRGVAVSSGPEQEEVLPQVIHFHPQTFNIIVNNTRIHRHPDKKKRCLIPEGCRPTFKPRINDRRYIHPSVFNGGSRQYIRPGTFDKKLGGTFIHPRGRRHIRVLR
jgi:hypothetical protein